MATTFTDEAAWVARVAAHVKRLGLRVPNPNYLESGSYAPQWRVRGATQEYKLPSAYGNLIIARAVRGAMNSTVLVFNARGLRT